MSTPETPNSTWEAEEKKLKKITWILSGVCVVVILIFVFLAIFVFWNAPEQEIQTAGKHVNFYKPLPSLPQYRPPNVLKKGLFGVTVSCPQDVFNLAIFQQRWKTRQDYNSEKIEFSGFEFTLENNESTLVIKEENSQVRFFFRDVVPSDTPEFFQITEKFDLDRRDYQVVTLTLLKDESIDLLIRRYVNGILDDQNVIYVNLVPRKKKACVQ